MSKYGVFCGTYFPAFRLIYGVNLRIQSECAKIRTRKNSVFGLFSRSVNIRLIYIHTYIYIYPHVFLITWQGDFNIFFMHAKLFFTRAGIFDLKLDRQKLRLGKNLVAWKSWWERRLWKGCSKSFPWRGETLKDITYLDFKNGSRRKPW